MLRKFVGNPIEQTLNRAAPFFVRHKITPNMLTLTGLGINVIAAYCYYADHIFVAGFIILLAGVFDMLDGAVARAGQQVSPFGGITDSVVDRYSDFVIFGGILAHFAARGNFSMTLLTAAILCGAFMISYVRARAELVIPKCEVGLMERPERIIVLAAGSLFGLFEAALWFLAVATHLTALHRIFYARVASRTLPLNQDRTCPPS